MRKATAATRGEENDVPEPEAYPDFVLVVVIPTEAVASPGATTSTQLP
jgi:hypothetical protein